MHFTYGLVDSFPVDMESKERSEVIADHYPPGEIARASVIIHTECEDLSLQDSLKNLPHVESVDDAEEGAENDQLKNWSVTYSISPYDSEAVNGIPDMRETAVKALEDAGVSDAEENVWVGGETATLYDTEEITSRDQ